MFAAKLRCMNICGTAVCVEHVCNNGPVLPQHVLYTGADPENYNDKTSTNLKEHSERLGPEKSK